MKLKHINWPGTIAALIFTVAFLVFPFTNPCQTEDGAACTWNAQTQGNGAGHSFTNYYGVTLYHIP